MPTASYYNLNSIYIFTTILIVFAVGIYLMQCYARVHYKLVDVNNSTCNDPVAMYFNKRLGRKCMTDRMSYMGDDINNNIKSVFSGINSTIDNLNNNMQNLTQKYDNRISANEAAEKQLLAEKQATIDNLAALVTKIKDLSMITAGGIEAMKYEYMVKLKTNLKSLVGIGNTIVQKLTSSIYTPNYKYTRAKYANGYDQIRKYLNRLLKDGIIVADDVKDNDGNLLMKLSEEARIGKKK